MLDNPTPQKLDAKNRRHGPTLAAGVFYGLALLLSAVVAMTIRVEWLGFWFMEGALFPLAFVLCLLGPNGPLRMGLAMLGGMVVGWFIVSPPAAFVMLFFGIFLVLLNALLIFAGALIGTLVRQGVVVACKRRTTNRSPEVVHARCDLEIGSEP
jgi:hypothetical protein